MNASVKAHVGRVRRLAQRHDLHPAVRAALRDGGEVVSLTVMPNRLEHLESVIERGLSTFVEVGEALLEIRDGRLYRATHATFEDYCRDRWHMSRIHAHRLIEASEVVSLLPMGNTVPSERVARELVPVMRQDPSHPHPRKRRVSRRRYRPTPPAPHRPLRSRFDRGWDAHRATGGRTHNVPIMGW